MKKILYALLASLIIAGCSSNIGSDSSLIVGPNQVTVNFDTRGGSPINSIVLDKGEFINLPSSIKEGHTLEGWYTSLNNGISFDEKWNFFTTPFNIDVTLYANWNINRHMVYFNSNGGTFVNAISLDFGTPLNLSSPTKQGHSFIDWYLNENFTQPLLFSTMPDESLNLFAKWSKNLYTITFDSAGGSQISPLSVLYGDSIILPEEPTRIGYTFQFWYLFDNLSWEYRTDTMPYMPDQDLVFTAHWITNFYTISFETNGGSPITTQTYSFGSSLNIPTPTKIGYSFVGWYTDNLFNLAFSIPPAMPASNLSLYAKWIVQIYSISYTPLLKLRKPSISTGSNHTLSLQANGQVFSWGSNSYGQLGDGTNTDKNIPTLISFSDLESEDFIESVQAGANHSLALTNSGKIYAWGSNSFGGLGDGTTINRNVPFSIVFPELENGEEIKNLSAGNEFSVVITTKGRVFTWGMNNSRLGDGTRDARSIPAPITFLELERDEIVIEVSSGNNHSIALTNLGRLYAWGWNNGRIGDGTTLDKNIPTLITFYGLQTGEFILSAKAGLTHSLAVTTHGRVFSWGQNGSGQIGDGTTIQRNIPTLIQFSELQIGETIRLVNSGESHSFAISTNGRFFSWGLNFNGRLGDGSTTRRYIPTLIETTDLEVGESMEKVLGGESHSIGITTFGRLLTWGYNSNGQLGDGTISSKLRPTVIEFLLGLEITQISPLVIDYFQSEFNSTIELVSPSIEGLEFAGWFLDKNLTLSFSSSSMPANDLELFASFITA
jgi:uncharacterized repeat protein (TIGR02543 family)